MQAKTWQFVVREFGATQPLSTTEVQARHWMGALCAGRKRIGQPAAVPAGASCQVRADGLIEVHVPAARVTYQLRPLEAAAEGSAGSAGPAPATSAPEPRAKGARERPRTIAYMASPLASAERAPIPVGSPAPPVPSAKEGRREAVKAPPAGTPKGGTGTPKLGTGISKGEVAAADTSAPERQPVPAKSAKVRDDNGAPADNAAPADKAAPADEKTPPNKQEIEKASAREQGPTEVSPAHTPLPPGPQGAKTSSSAPPASADAAWNLLHRRDADPSEENPLTYRERAFYVGTRTSLEQARTFLTARLEELRGELGPHKPGVFINLAAFDHRWESEPAGAPLAVLRWKDWRGEPEFLVGGDGHDTVPDRYTGERERSLTPLEERDARVSEAFEQCQGLETLTAPHELMAFVVDLLVRLIPSEAVDGCLYDINADAFRFVATNGPQADALRGSALSASGGLLGRAAHQPAPLSLTNPSADAAYDAAGDVHPTLDCHSVLFAAVNHHGELLGLVRLCNRSNQGNPSNQGARPPQGPSGAAHFTESDVHLVSYVAGQLGPALHRARALLGSKYPMA